MSAIAVMRLRGRGHVPSRRVLQCLRFGWANSVYSGSVEYLEEVARQAIEARGSIVEAGSGLTSVVLSYVAGPDQIVVSVEHLAQWADRVDRYTSGRGRHRVLTRPLRSYDEYDWYSIAADDLPARVALVVIDGPPGGTRGGRYGALPQLAASFGAAAVLLLDDADRSSEKNVLARWARETRAEVELRDEGSRAFAVVTIPRPAY
jgi:hypothetical protein